MILTIAKLRKLGACTAALDNLQRIFGPGPITVTEALCVTHATDGVNWDWAAYHLLPPAAQAEYDRVRAAARAKYDRVRAPASAEYERVSAAAWAEYDLACAATFGRLAETRRDSYDKPRPDQDEAIPSQLYLRAPYGQRHVGVRCR